MNQHINQIFYPQFYFPDKLNFYIYYMYYFIATITPNENLWGVGWGSTDLARGGGGGAK